MNSQDTPGAASGKKRSRRPPSFAAALITAAPKREELRTYRELALPRELKSARLRRRVEARGTERVIGDGSLSQPWLKVLTVRFRETRRRVQRELLLQARRSPIDLPLDALLEHLHARIESLTYAHFAQSATRQAAHGLTTGPLGRSLTVSERAHFAEALALGADSIAPGSPIPRASGRALDRVLGQIEQRQEHNPARCHTLWAEVVGAEIALQATLEKVDPATQTAWIRCYNSVLSMHLQRQAELPARLSKALGQTVRQIKSHW